MGGVVFKRRAVNTVADDLISNLKASSKRWATQITTEATKNLGKYKTLIRVRSKTAQQDAGKLAIIATAYNTGKQDGDVKNVARAYEYGSGLHSKKARRKILIRARKKKVLAFFWDVATSDPENFKFDDKGRVLLKSVQHPGVKAANSGKGYLKPAIDKVRRQIRKEVPAGVRKAVLGTFRKAFK